MKKPKKPRRVWLVVEVETTLSDRALMQLDNVSAHSSWLLCKKPEVLPEADRCGRIVSLSIGEGGKP